MRMPLFIKISVELSIRNCIKRPLGVKMGIKVDKWKYQKIKYPILIYNHGYQKNQIAWYCVQPQFSIFFEKIK